MARCQMPPCPVPDALNLPGLALIGGDQLGDRLVGRVGGDLHARRVEVDQPDGRVRRAGELGETLPVHHPDFDGDEADRIAVGRRRGDRRVADDAAAARAIDDVDGLADLLFEQRADDPRRCVGAAAGGPRHDEGDRAFRIRRLGDDGERERAQGDGTGERAREFEHDSSWQPHECDVLGRCVRRLARRGLWSVAALQKAVKWSDQFARISGAGSCSNAVYDARSLRKHAERRPGAISSSAGGVSRHFGIACGQRG